MTQPKLDETLNERGSNYGNFHTHANLSQTLSTIAKQHYSAVRAVPGQPAPQLPNFMAEALHMICHKLARICNGDPNHVDSWHDIAGYSQLVVQILTEQQQLAEKAAKDKAMQELEKASDAQECEEEEETTL